ncbi:MAG: TadE/TadG family type IV pilus assembly protein [Bdellovibrionota bacterium]|jgi:hypothetical protein
MMNKHHLKNNSAGAVLVELALLAPILLLLTLGGIELVFELRHINSALTLSNTAATYAFRECSSHKYIHGPGKCLDRIEREMTTFAQNNIDQHSHVVLSAYYNDGTNREYHASSGTLPPKDKKVKLGGRCLNMWDRDQIGNDAKQISDRAGGMVIIAQSYIYYEPLIGVLRALFIGDASNKYICEQTII